jgi:enoyl-CoA hydratase
MNTPKWQFFQLRFEGPIAWIMMAQPQQANALSAAFWDELPEVVAWLNQQDDLRVAILAGEGKHFCAGITLDMLEGLIAMMKAPAQIEDGRERVRAEILRLQASMTALEALRVPVIAAVHGACIGGGVDLIGACDLRFAAADARFCIKEVDFGIVADVGTTQRLRHIIGLAALTELSFTAETFDAAKAERLGLVGPVLPDRDALYAHVTELAQVIASKPPRGVRGVKQSLLFARDHSVAEGLVQAAEWNAAVGIGANMDELLAPLRARTRKN